MLRKLLVARALNRVYRNKVQGETVAERDTHRVSRVRGGPKGVSPWALGGGSEGGGFVLRFEVDGERLD